MKSIRFFIARRDRTILLILMGCFLFEIHPAFCQSIPEKLDEYRTQLAKDTSRVEVRLQLAQIYLQIEAYEQAATEYLHVLETEPAACAWRAETYYGLGLALTGLEKFDEAIKFYTDAIAITPERAHLYAALGSAYANMHRYPEALSAYNTAVMFGPDDARLHHHLGNVYSKRGKREEAMTHQLRAIAIEPELAPAHYEIGRLYAQQKQWDKAIVAYQTAYAHDEAQLEALYNLAQAYRRRGDDVAAREQMVLFEKRQAVLNQIHQLRGTFQRTQNRGKRAQLLANIGRLYLKSGAYQKALWEYQKAIGQDAQLATAYNGIGITYALLKKYPEAIAAQQKALAINPNFAKAHAGLGLIYLMQERAELALHHYRQAVALAPQLIEAHRKIGLILLNGKRYAAAAAAYRAILKHNSHDTMAHHNLGLCYAHQGKTEPAIASLQKAVDVVHQLQKERTLAVPPFLGETYYLLGELYAAQRKFEFAKKAYLNSKLPKAYDALAQLIAKLANQHDIRETSERFQHLEAALHYAQTAIRFAPNVASYYNTFALIAFRKADYIEAERAIRKAVALEPDNPGYQAGLKHILNR